MFGKKSKAASDRVYFQNAVKTLVANIRFASVDDPIRVISVASSVPNEGKSSISVALAQALAASGQSTLLIECDMRRRTLANMLGTHAQYGIYGVLSGKVDLEDAAVKTSTPGMFFLDAEPHIPNPVDILSSKRFASFVELVRRTYGYVVIDTPPISAFVDGAVISSNVDGTLLVARENFVKRDEILSAYDQLKKAGANVIGTVLNFCETDRSEHYYDYYSKGGKGKKGASNAGAPSLPDKPLSQQTRAAQPRGHQAQAGRAAAPAASGLKPLPNSGSGSPDSTMSFLRQTGYQSSSDYDD